MEKKEKLLEEMSRYAREDVMVAFSGGVDSALLLKLACVASEESGKEVYAVPVLTTLDPCGELEESNKMCRE